ncbi:MAG: hypothetical protein ABL898_15910 [Hyphomicrobiaceae bacterium]|nr:hypothetical protein [Hyphomicrobiaceae bacterium]
MPILPAIIGIAGGLASAVLFYSAVRGSLGLSLALFLLTPLPSLITAFGWGLPAAIAGALVGAAVMAVAIAPTFGAGYFLVLGAPTILAAHLILLVQYAEDGTVKSWFPTGSMIAGLALYGSAIPIMMAPFIGGSYQTMEPDVMRFMERLAQSSPPSSGWRMDPARMKTMAAFWVDAMPAALSSYWTFFFSLNAYFAARATHASGSLPRPWPQLARIVYPVAFALLFGLAIVALSYPGAPRIIGASVVGALTIAFMFMGLSVVHALAAKRGQWLLMLTYAATVIATGIVAPILAAIGLGETLMRFRDKIAPPPPPPRQPNMSVVD